VPTESIHSSILMPGTGLDDNRRFLQQLFLGHVDAVATSLAQAAANTLVVNHQRCQESGPLNRLSSVVDFCADLSEFDRVVASRRTLIDTKLARFLSRMGKTSLKVEERQSHASVSFRRTLQELNGLSLKEPKTKAGKRIVSLGTEALDALKSRLAKAFDEGFEPEHVPIVFPNIRGGYMRGSNFDRNVWYPIREAAGIPETFVFHDLRHTQASLMLAAGVDLKVIQKRLGHQDFSTTANTYSHLLQNAENEAVSRVDDLMSKRAPKPAPETGEYSR
jgi:hypothetical protein